MSSLESVVVPQITELREKATTALILEGGAGSPTLLSEEERHLDRSTVIPANPRTVTRTTCVTSFPVDTVPFIIRRAERVGAPCFRIDLDADFCSVDLDLLPLEGKEGGTWDDIVNLKTAASVHL